MGIAPEVAKSNLILFISLSDYIVGMCGIDVPVFVGVLTGILPDMVLGQI